MKKTAEEKAKKIYDSMTSYANYSEMNGIRRGWILECIERGLKEYKAQDNWISVGDDLPRDRESVIINYWCGVTKKNHVSEAIFYEQDLTFHADSGGEFDNTTHWRRLPQPLPNK